MLVSMIGALAQPVALAMSLYSSAESLTTVMLHQEAPVAKVATVKAVAATKEELSEITAPGIQLSQYLTPAGKASMCAALAQTLGTKSTSAAMNQAMRDCYPEASNTKGVESTISTKAL
ncbi:hypothetical protein P5706_34445 [Pseudomonas sp. ChxA]|jgi:hypothetical protein|uniref:hypothetical protein n=1 Tax=Pseudomonas TaxID=286 RepID=UPI0009978217|nr:MULTISPECIES: hypothetical protein [Pseudomonas]MBF6043089.1 hypothetical protein [Pseudomonas mucoides]MBJ2203783.1 hypothetical protein [Pseudomonas carnis]MBX9409861.1 hypothetical protein [Pseudomonas baetica]MDL2189271.1 hypothetical protein [Pseudomonas sp. ChxA]NMX83862.1 hypothetical protein [Pseudomonas sp. WS 5503]